MVSLYNRGSWQQSPGGPDVIGLTRRALERIPETGPPPSLFQHDAYKGQRGRGWWMDIIWTLDEGMNLQVGRANQGTDHARLGDSTMVTKNYREATLPLAQVNTTEALGYTGSWMQQIRAFDTQVILIPDTAGGGATEQIYLESGTGAATPSAHAIGSMGTCLAFGYINGITTPHLIVGRAGGGFRVYASLADLGTNTPVAGAAGNVLTTSLWGACQTTLPGLPWVFCCTPGALGSVIAVLRNTDDSGVAVSPGTAANYAITLPRMPSGGSFLGLLGFGGAEPRVFMLTPHTSTASGHMAGPARCHLESVKQDGYDSNRHDLSQWGLSYAIQGCAWRGGIVLRDERVISWSNGYETRRIRWNDQPPLYSDRDRRIVNFYPISDNELVLEVNDVGAGTITGTAASDTGVANTVDLSGTAAINQDSAGFDDFYVAWLITTTGGTGSGQTRLISDFDGVSGLATVSTNWGTRPDATTTFSMTPATRMQYLTYNWNKGEVTAESERTTFTASGVQSLPYAANGGAKATNGYRYGYAAGAFRAGPIPEPGRGLFSQAQTLGASAGSGLTFAESGFFTRPTLHWPDAIRESNKYVLWAYMGGALYDGQRLVMTQGHTAPITWEAPVGESINPRSRYKPLTKNRSFFRDWAPTFTLTRGTALARQARTTGQPLPITVFGEYEEIGASYR